MNCQVDKEEGGDTFPQASLLPVPQNPSFQGGARISRNTINYKSIKTKEYKLEITNQLQRNSSKGIQIVKCNLLQINSNKGIIEQLC